MSKTVIIKVNQEQANYLQRLGVEVDGKSFIIDRMFSNHAMDEDTALFESVPFKHFMKEFEQANAEWDLAKNEFQESYVKPVIKAEYGENTKILSWQIEDYNSLECKVIIEE